MCNESFIGKCGFLWLEYMEQNYPEEYRKMIREQTARKKACEINDEAWNMMDSLTDKYLKNNKPAISNSTMEMWKVREQAKAFAEEIVLADIVYHFY